MWWVIARGKSKHFNLSFFFYKIPIAWSSLWANRSLETSGATRLTGMNESAAAISSWWLLLRQTRRFWTITLRPDRTEASHMLWFGSQYSITSSRFKWSFVWDGNFECCFFPVTPNIRYIGNTLVWIVDQL
jgi:hypothetical protein